MVDRSAEFHAVVDAIRLAEGVHSAPRALEPSTAAAKGGDTSDHARFTAAVAQLGKEIHGTTMKLQELAKSKGGVGLLHSPLLPSPPLTSSLLSYS